MDSKKSFRIRYGRFRGLGRYVNWGWDAAVAANRALDEPGNAIAKPSRHVGDRHSFILGVIRREVRCGNVGLERIDTDRRGAFLQEDRNMRRPF